jgi:Spy/CpxP family protein refolding chaperone
MTRKVADCRKTPSEINCSLTITGEEDEVVRAAVEHAVSAHGHVDTPELREQVRGLLDDEGATSTRGNVEFVQLIEFTTRQRDQLNQLMDEWEDRTGGKRTATRAVLTQDHEQPGTYYEFVEFPTYEDAARNSQLPETDELSQRMRALCDGEPRFHDLDVVRAESL